MKKFLYTLTAKILCFILCIISLALTVVSVCAALFIQGNGYYDTNKNVLIEREFYYYFANDCYNILSSLYDNSDNIGVYTNANTNLRYKVTDNKGNIIDTNIEVHTDNTEWKYRRCFLITEIDGENNIASIPAEKFDYTSNENCIVEAYFQKDLPINDKYSFTSEIISFCYSIRYSVYFFATFFLLLFIILFVILMCVSGRRYGSQSIYPGVLNSVPLDLIIALSVFTLGYIIYNVYLSYFDEVVLIYFAVGLLASILFIGISMSISARIKQGTLFSNTIIYKACRIVLKTISFVFRGIAKLLSVIPLAWKALLILAVVSFLELFVISSFFYGDDFFYFYWIVEKIIIVLIVLYFVGIFKRICKGTEVLATGDFEHRIDTSLMFGDFKRHAQALNNIAEISNVAVEKRLQSERMKTELITNVSHDIKTPLTSIINYSSLIAKEDCDDGKYKEYAEVLLKKSKDLKRLLEDLIEVSKTTSGNIELNMTSCDGNVLVEQIFGEYKEKTDKEGLELVISKFSESEKIKVDSKKIWRVFENVMNNACKYSLCGTRIYVDCKTVGNKAFFIFKNTSKTPLNISPEEIMERFVRGDSSRLSEGSGLGLSIAKNLTELQGGTFDLHIDGDLFKVIIAFPVIKE